MKPWSNIRTSAENGTGLPRGWEWTTLSEVADVKGGLAKGQKRKPGQSLKPVPYLRVANVQRGFLDLTEVKCIDATPDEIQNLLLKHNDILFNEGGDRDKLGRGWVWQGELPECIHQNHVFRARLRSSDIEPRYISWYANSVGQQYFMSGGKQTTNLASLNLSTLRALPIPLPPSHEQTRICHVLDVLLGQVDSCRERLERVPVILKRFRKAVLAAATSGKLTEDWREQQRMPSCGVHTHLKAVASGFDYGSSAKSAATGSIPVLRMGNIQNGEVDWSDLAFSNSTDEIAKYALKPGDVLFNRTNSPDLVGKSALYKGERPAIFAGYLIRVRCGIEILPGYLNYCLNSPAGRDYCWKVKSDGVSQSNINAKKLADFTFLLPCVEEQEEIIRRVEVLLSRLKQLESNLDEASETLVTIATAVLSKAFRGELVPQDESDEPASELLKRMCKDREERLPKKDKAMVV